MIFNHHDGDLIVFVDRGGWDVETNFEPEAPEPEDVVNVNAFGGGDELSFRGALTHHAGVSGGPGNGTGGRGGPDGIGDRIRYRLCQRRRTLKQSGRILILKRRPRVRVW